MYNKYNKWLRYRNNLARHKKYQFGMTTINLVGVDMIEIAQNEQHKMNRIR